MQHFMDEDIREGWIDFFFSHFSRVVLTSHLHLILAVVSCCYLYLTNPLSILPRSIPSRVHYIDRLVNEAARLCMTHDSSE